MNQDRWPPGAGENTDGREYAHLADPLGKYPGQTSFFLLESTKGSLNISFLSAITAAVYLSRHLACVRVLAHGPNTSLEYDPCPRSTSTTEPWATAEGLVSIQWALLRGGVWRGFGPAWPYRKSSEMEQCLLLGCAVI